MLPSDQNQPKIDLLFLGWSKAIESRLLKCCYKALEFRKVSSFRLRAQSIRAPGREGGGGMKNDD